MDHVAVHPGYKKPLRELQEGDAAPLIAFLANSDDIALIKLQQPVTDVTQCAVTEERTKLGGW